VGDYRGGHAEENNKFPSLREGSQGALFVGRIIIKEKS
jgi:hypothetical protein